MRTGGEAVRTHAEERMKVSRNEMMGDRFWMRRGRREMDPRQRRAVQMAR